MNADSCASQISRMIRTFMLLTASSTLALSCGRLVLDSQQFISLVKMAKAVSYAGFFYIQVKSGTLFDNIIITDDPALAKKFAEDTWAKHKEVCFSFCNTHHCLMVDPTCTNYDEFDRLRRLLLTRLRRRRKMR